MQMAEKRCRRLRLGAVPYSPELAAAGLELKLWRLVVRHKQGKNVNSRYIRRTTQQCGLSQVLRKSLDEAQQHLRNAKITYSKIKRNAYTSRHNFLQDRMNKATSTKACKEIAHIICTEESRLSWRAINRSRGKRAQKGISAIEVQINGVKTKITDQSEVESAIMNNNSARFHLTNETPMMQAPMVSQLGYLANGPLAQTILNGELRDDVVMDDYTKKFLHFIGKRSTLPSLSSNISAEDFSTYWRSSKEKTASLISDRHFGHYKAASTRQLLSQYHASILSLASNFGLHLSRWTKGLTVMLEKSENDIRVEKLRAILLMEADFNFVNKLIFGHRMIQQCERYRRFPKELYGSRNHHSAYEVAVNRRLSIENMKQKRRNGIIAGVDAAQCYDRIVHSVATLLCRNEGASRSTLLLMFGAIQNMEYFIRTTFGESSSSYGGPQLIPFQGSCQGNGASPAIWLVISMYLVLLLQEAGHFSTCSTAYSGTIFALLGFLFVDDTDLIILGEDGENIAILDNGCKG